MKEGIKKAKDHCANYNNGQCLGVMLKHTKGKMHQWIDSSYLGKCKLSRGKECEYIRTCVKLQWIQGVGFPFHFPIPSTKENYEIIQIDLSNFNDNLGLGDINLVL